MASSDGTEVSRIQADLPQRDSITDRTSSRQRSSSRDISSERSQDHLLARESRHTQAVPMDEPSELNGPMATEEGTGNGQGQGHTSSRYSDADVHIKAEHSEHDEDGPSPSASGGPPLFACGFFDQRLRSQRTTYLKTVLMGELLTCICIIALLSPYWASFFRTPDLVPKLRGFIVDLDGGEIGSMTTQQFLQQSGGPTQMTWQSMTYGSADEVREAVVEQQCWVAVVINAGASQNLTNAIDSADSQYNGTHAITVFVNQARNQYAYPFETQAYQAVLVPFESMFASQQARQLATNGNLATLLADAPSVVTQPVSYTSVNLLPFEPNVANAAVFVGLIYVTIFAFILTMQNYNGRMPLAKYLSLKQLVILRLVSPVVGYFFLSLCYGLLNLAFKIPFDRKFGNGGFVVYWMLSWCAMMALGFALEAMITVLTVKFISFFLVLWVIVNVSVAFYPIDLLPGVFRYGYAMPFYQFGEGTRCIVCANTDLPLRQLSLTRRTVGTKNKLGLNFGVLIAWTLVSMATTSLFTAFDRRRAIRQERKSQRSEA